MVTELADTVFYRMHVNDFASSSRQRHASLDCSNVMSVSINCANSSTSKDSTLTAPRSLRSTSLV